MYLNEELRMKNEESSFIRHIINEHGRHGKNGKYGFAFRKIPLNP